MFRVGCSGLASQRRSPLRLLACVVFIVGRTRVASLITLSVWPLRAAANGFVVLVLGDWVASQHGAQPSAVVCVGGAFGA